MKPVPIIAFLAVLMGCNADEIRDWDDDKLVALGVNCTTITIGPT